MKRVPSEYNIVEGVQRILRKKTVFKPTLIYLIGLVGCDLNFKKSTHPSHLNADLFPFCFRS